MSKISLAQQLEEIDAIIAAFPSYAKWEKLRDSVAEFRLERQRAIRESLQRQADNEGAPRPGKSERAAW